MPSYTLIGSERIIIIRPCWKAQVLDKVELEKCKCQKRQCCRLLPKAWGIRSLFCLEQNLLVQIQVAWRFSTRTSGPSFFEGWLAFNPGFFFFSSKAFSQIIFSVIFKSIRSSTCWQKELNWIYFLSFKIWIQFLYYPWVFLTQLWTTRPSHVCVAWEFGHSTCLWLWL